MSLSMKIALDSLNEKKGDIDMDELMFVFTVLRDNAKYDDVHELLDRMIKEQHNKFLNKKK
ncbi:hypothetical protein MHH33_12645 [Paenisporosarcina sp. FSL H8-0542]|uniref:hypothetical protein n=1 Tax=Paenisporosarcina sp. FSL H8-0542 TaxID=2921401 RepID=UPI00315A0DE4